MPPRMCRAHTVLEHQSLLVDDYFTVSKISRVACFHFSRSIDICKIDNLSMGLPLVCGESSAQAVGWKAWRRWKRDKTSGPSERSPAFLAMPALTGNRHIPVPLVILPVYQGNGTIGEENVSLAHAGRPDKRDGPRGSAAISPVQMTC